MSDEEPVDTMPGLRKVEIADSNIIFAVICATFSQECEPGCTDQLQKYEVCNKKDGEEG